MIYRTPTNWNTLSTALIALGVFIACMVESPGSSVSSLNVADDATAFRLDISYEVTPVGSTKPEIHETSISFSPRSLKMRRGNGGAWAGLTTMLWITGRIAALEDACQRLPAKQIAKLEVTCLSSGAKPDHAWTWNNRRNPYGSKSAQLIYSPYDSRWELDQKVDGLTSAAALVNRFSSNWAIIDAEKADFSEKETSGIASEQPASSLRANLCFGDCCSTEAGDESTYLITSKPLGEMVVTIPLEKGFRAKKSGSLGVLESYITNLSIDLVFWQGFLKAASAGPQSCASVRGVVTLVDNSR